MTPQKGTEKFSCNASLYKFVYKGTTSITAALLLCVCFFVASVDPVFASEEIDSETNIINAENIENITPPPSDDSQEIEDLNNDEDNAEEVTEEAQSDEGEFIEVEEEATDTEALSEEQDSTSTQPETSVNDSETNNNDSPQIASTTPVSTSTDTEVDEGNDNDDSNVSGESDNEVEDIREQVLDDFEGSQTTDDDLLEDNEDADENATSTATSTATLERVDTVTNDDNYFQFSRDECVRVADGSFYCGVDEEEVSEEASSVNSLFAAPDSGGDLEIFLRYEGEVQQISFNNVEDSAPYFDAKSNTIVWHSLINDRYQIVSYSLDTGEETLITATGVNNMEPSRFGDMTAWQRWVGSSWEIILFDGKNETQISEPGRHDVAPLVYESFVLWNTTAEDGTQRIVMYDIETGQRELIEDTEGAAVQNPRMVLLYETTLPSGDTVTKGFDLESRTVVPLGVQPKNVPTEIPSSDQTGETRALIQEKQTGRQTEIVHSSSTPSTNNNATSTKVGVVNATSTPVVATSTPISATSTPAIETAPTTSTSTTNASSSTSVTPVPDLIIPKYSPATTTQATTTPLDEIEDLVIPPSQPNTE